MAALNINEIISENDIYGRCLIVISHNFHVRTLFPHIRLHVGDTLSLNSRCMPLLYNTIQAKREYTA